MLHNDVQVLPQRVYLNAFPKAGTHLAELFVRLTAAPVTDTNWLGSFNHNAWTTQWVQLDRFQACIDNWPAGGYYKGHCGYSPDIAAALWNQGISVIFVYRNLRDVVVSQAYHVLNTDQHKGADALKHPGKWLFADMPFDDVVLACIRGIDIYPGIADRWREYRDWLQERWVLPVCYEDMVNEPRETGSRILRYVTGQTASFYGQHITLPRGQHDTLVDAMLALIEQHKPATYRRGKPGGWLDDWSDKIETAWRSSGAHMMNRELGYE